MLEKIRYFYQHKFVRRLAFLQTGNVLEILIQALSGIIIARLLQPELFGIFTLAFSLASLISILLGTGVIDAMTTLSAESYAAENKESLRIALGFLVKFVAIAGVVTFFGALAAPWIAQHLYHNSAIGWYAAVVVLAAIISNSFFSFSTLSLQIVNRIGAMSILGITDQLLRFGLSILLVLGGFQIAGAVLGHLIGALLVFIISVLIWEWLRKTYPIFPSLSELARHAKLVNIRTHLSLSFWTIIDRNIGMLYMILPVFLVGIFVSPSEVTYFKLAFGFINLAMALLGPISILLNVEFPKIKITDAKELRGKFIRISLYSMALSSLITAGTILVAPWVFRILYGASFLPSVRYVRELAVYGVLYGIGIGLGPMWRAVRRVKTSIVISLIILAIGLPIGILMMKVWGLAGAVTMVTAWFTLAHFVSFFTLTSILNKPVVTD